MNPLSYVTLQSRPGLKDPAAAWFSSTAKAESAAALPSLLRTAVLVPASCNPLRRSASSKEGNSERYAGYKTIR